MYVWGVGYPIHARKIMNLLRLFCVSEGPARCRPDERVVSSLLSRVVPVLVLSVHLL